MQTVSLIWGILALVGMLVGFVPFYGALNWLLIPFAGIGAIVSAVRRPSLSQYVACSFFFSPSSTR